MEGISGHLSSRDGFSRHGPTLTAAPEWPDKPHANGYFYGEHDYRSHHSHHHQQQQPQQSIMRGSGGGNSGMGVGTGVGRGNGNVRSVPHLHQHPPSSMSHQADRHEISILSSSRDPQSRDLSMNASGDASGQSRMSMSVQDLKNMTAIRMAQQQGGQSSGSPRQSPPGTNSQGQPSRSVIVHPQDLNTARGASAGPQHLRGHNAGQQQNQHQQSPAIMPQLSRHNSAQAMGVSGYSGHQNGGGRAQLVVAQGGRGLDQGVHVMDQHHIPQRSMHRGTSAPRLFSQSDESNGAGRVFAHGLSVEELKEMTKLRLQNQQGRASPTSTLQRSSSASRAGGTRGDIHHDRMEWRHGSLNDRRSMIEEPLHGVPRRPSALSLGHGVSRESVPAAGLGRRMYNGSAAAGRDSVGRMDTPLLLEDRMRALQTETAGGSPRILSQPSSPCYSQPGSPTSSPCHSSHNSPGRHNRNGQGGRRDGGGGNGAAVSVSSSVGHNYPTPPPGFSEGPGNVQHISLRLNGSGGGAGGNERSLYLRRGASSDFSQTSSTSGSSGGMNGGPSGAGGAPALLMSRSYSDASPHVSPHLAASGTTSRRGSPLMDSTGPASIESVEPANGNAYGARVVRTRSYDGRVTAASMLSVPRPSSASLSPPAGESHLGFGDILANGVHGHGSMTGAGGGSEFDRVRRSSFDDRLPARWVEAQDGDLSASAHGSIGGRKGSRRPASLNLGADHFDQLRSAAAAVTASGGAGPSSSYNGGLGLNSGLVGPELPSVRAVGGGGMRGVPASTKDAIPTQCAEFALLTPKRALVQQAGSATMTSWSTTWDSDEVNGERAPGGGDAAPGGAPAGGSVGGRDTVDTEFVHGNGPGPEGGVRGGTGSDPLMQHAAGGMFGGPNSAAECQVPRSGSSEGSPEPFGASRGNVDETEENGASSCGSGGGGRQHNVQAAFEVLDAAVGRGGGGGEASNGSSGNGNGAGYDGYTVGSDVHDAARNGGVEVEAQRFGCPVTASVPASAFFGEDLPDCAGMSLEGDDGHDAGMSLEGHDGHDAGMSLEGHDGHDEETSSEQQSSLGGGKSSPPPLAGSSSSPGSIYSTASTTVAHNRTPSPAQQQQQQQQQPKHSPSGVVSDPLATAMENQLAF